MEYIDLLKLVETFFDGGEQVTIDLETYNSLQSIFESRKSPRDFVEFLSSYQMKREFIVVAPQERFTALVVEYCGLCFAGPKAVLMLHLEKELAGKYVDDGEIVNRKGTECCHAADVLGLLSESAPMKFIPSFTTFKSSREESCVRLTKGGSKDGDRFSLLDPNHKTIFVDRKIYMRNHFHRKKDETGTWRRKHSHSVAGRHFFFDFKGEAMEWRQSSEFPRKIFM